jgi:hypothetical protein
LVLARESPDCVEHAFPASRQLKGVCTPVVRARPALYEFSVLQLIDKPDHTTRERPQFERKFLLARACRRGDEPQQASMRGCEFERF